MPNEKFDFSPKKKTGDFSPEKLKILEELTELGEKTGNNLVFEDYGGETGESFGNLKIDKKILETQNEEDKQIVQFAQRVLREYINSPIFADDFHTDHNSRRKWENNDLLVVSEEARSFYNRNCLGVNNMGHVHAFLELIETSIHNLEIKGQISKLRNDFPKELLGSQNVSLEYTTLEDSKKIEVAKRVKEIARQAIDIIEEKAETKI